MHIMRRISTGCFIARPGVVHCYSSGLHIRYRMILHWNLPSTRSVRGIPFVDEPKVLCIYLGMVMRGASIKRLQSGAEPQP